MTLSGAKPVEHRGPSADAEVNSKTKQAGLTLSAIFMTMRIMSFIDTISQEPRFRGSRKSDLVILGKGDKGCEGASQTSELDECHTEEA